MTKETWKGIKNFDGYEVSDLGSVRRIKTIRFARPRILKSYPNPKGYLCISFRSNGKVFTLRVHRLVLQAFVGDCPQGYEVDHINANKQDNRLINLEYVTGKENCRRARELGLYKSPSGEKSGRAKLTVAQVKEIRNRLAKKDNKSVIAKDFNICLNNIYAIKHRKSWKNI